MTLTTFYGLSCCVIGGVLALAFIAVLLRNYFGAKLKPVYAIGGLLLLNSLLWIGFGVMFFFYPKNHYVYWWLDIGILSLIDLTFNVGHYILAYTYRTVSIEQPLKL